jgi:peptidoglycan hydrolase CwlO-like protein
MSPERQRLKGDLQDAERRYRELDLLAQDKLTDIRTLLNPYEEDLTKLDIEKAETFMKDLKEKHTELKKLKTKIEKMKEDLYG